MCLFNNIMLCMNLGKHLFALLHQLTIEKFILAAAYMSESEVNKNMDEIKSQKELIQSYEELVIVVVWFMVLFCIVMIWLWRNLESKSAMTTAKFAELETINTDRSAEISSLQQQIVELVKQNAVLTDQFKKFSKPLMQPVTKLTTSNHSKQQNSECSAKISQLQRMVSELTKKNVTISEQSELQNRTTMSSLQSVKDTTSAKLAKLHNIHDKHTATLSGLRCNVCDLARKIKSLTDKYDSQNERLSEFKTSFRQSMQSTESRSNKAELMPGELVPQAKEIVVLKNEDDVKKQLKQEEHPTVAKKHHELFECGVCCIEQSEKSRVVFNPCCHGSCSTCGGRMDKCFICGTIIESRIRQF